MYLSERHLPPFCLAALIISSRVRRSNPAHLGHQVPFFLIPATATYQVCPFLHSHCNGVLLLMYSLLRHLPSCFAASSFISSRVRGANPAHLRHQLPRFLTSVGFASHLCPFLHCHRTLVAELT